VVVVTGLAVVVVGSGQPKLKAKVSFTKPSPIKEAH